MNIEIITTANEKLNESGFGSLSSCSSILEAVIKMGHNVLLNLYETKNDLRNTVMRKPDLVILAVKYIITEDGETIWLSEFFAENGINFSGSSKDTLMFDSDKVLAKSYLKDKGIGTPRYFTAAPEEYKRDYDIPINYPLFLKPINSVNYNCEDEYSLVNNFTEFENKVLSLHNLYNVPILVEEYIDGQDYTVSIIKAQDGNILVCAVEILEPKLEKSIMVLGEEVKKQKKKKLVSIEDKVIKNRVENLAIDAYIDLKIRDFGQINIKKNKSGDCLFMQVNLVPDMTNGTSRFLEAFTIEQGLNYNEVIGLMVDEGISRV
ncbi:ATP-grasp domain-containing protein [Candidatus Woesearchaeota archaeon]|nr:ATP-grasp domain-containing protein [Candidatus Woesearchaeota archaeon]